jgi:hypothetical protein
MGIPQEEVVSANVSERKVCRLPDYVGFSPLCYFTAKEFGAVVYPIFGFAA